MNRFIPITLFLLTITHIVTAQNEKLIVEGAIVIADNEETNPIAGTIRWTGQDFEGFDGATWRSLTCGCDPDVACPDDRYITHATLNVTEQSIQLEVEMSQDLPMRLAYYVSSNPGAINYRTCEYSANYGASGREHLQTITGLAAGTEYTIIIQTSQDVGTSSADCPTMNWEDISCPITVLTLSQSGGQFLTLSDFNAAVHSNDQTSSGNWSGVHGSTPSGCSNSNWIRSEIQANGNFGSARKYLFDSSVKEAWVSYSVQIGTNWTPSSNVKMPGFSSHVNGGTTSVSGGNGGGWSGLCKSWSARPTIVRPSFASTPGRLQQYLYHLDSNGFNSGSTNLSDHPCIDPSNNPVQSSRLQYGQTYNASPVAQASITDNNWHCITQHIKLNTINTSNPNDPNAAYRDGLSEMYLDGVLVSSVTGLHFTNNPAYHNISFMLQVFHGGSADNTGTTHDVFFDCINITTGPTNGTQCNDQ